MEVSIPTISELRRRTEDLERRHREGLLRSRRPRYHSPRRDDRVLTFLPIKEAVDREVPSRQRLEEEIDRLTSDCHKLRRYLNILARRREDNSYEAASEDSVEGRVRLVQRQLLREELTRMKKALQGHLGRGHRWADEADMAQSIVLDLDRRIESISNGPPGIVSEIDRRTLLVERDAQVAAAATAEEHMLAAALVCRELQVRVAVLKHWLASSKPSPKSSRTGLKLDVDEELVVELLKVRSKELGTARADLLRLDSTGILSGCSERASDPT